MEKRSQKTTPEDPQAPKRPDMEGWRVWWLVNEETGSSRGVVVLSVVPPGKRHVLHRHPNCEQVTYVLSGSGLHLTTGEPVRQEQGDAAYIEPGEWHGFENDSDGTTAMVAVYGGVGSAKAAGYELYPADCPGAGHAAAKDGKEVTKVSPKGRASSRSTRRNKGSADSNVSWLVTSESVGAKKMALGTFSFEPGVRQELHRHPNADEIVLVTSGGGVHLMEDGEVPLREGEIAYVPAGEWHGFRNDPDATTTAVLAYFGVADPVEAGHEEPRDAGDRAP